ncbi:MAG: Coenzyme F420 hydrogenase/dehydrogenase, beta subunit C-terminal domain [Candidatus Thermoplasmatota archaeon]|nr:Coenzyme F420 hydrogenase/dehydrogenase, beta subunit C-terminal domain [Candidatus Thermoplasmatota archaeon]
MAGRAGFAELKEKVIDERLCTRCGGCAASCPVGCLDMGPDGVELVGECIECGICSRICPGSDVDISAHERRLFGRKHRPLEAIQGIRLDRECLVASDKVIFKRGYFGGRVSALLIHLLDSGEMDAALLTDFSRKDGVLSTGSAAIARSREDVLSCAGSKNLFSPVLMLLRSVSEDPSINSAALVCLPCQAHAFRNMETDLSTRHLTAKVRLVVGLNCGAPNVDERGWHQVIGSLMGMPTDDISSIDIRRIKGGKLRMEAVSFSGDKKRREMTFARYSLKTLSQGVWPRCLVCADYSCYLSDITFGAPIVRTEAGRKALRSAKRAGVLKRSSLKRRAAQRAIDLYAGHRKVMGSRVRMLFRRKGQRVRYR